MSEQINEQNITRFQKGDKEYILIGTAHVSPLSAETVKQIILEEKPDTVCIELDPGRYKTMTEKQQWSETNFINVIKEGKAGLMFVNILLSNYQQKIAKQFDIRSGQEMVEGIAAAKETNAELVLADRDIQVTFKRVWKGCGFIEKCKLITTIIMSFLDKEEMTEEDLEALKTEDMLTAALTEFGASFKGVKKYLVDERDIYLKEKVKHAPGNKIVAVLGAAHVPGMIAHWDDDDDTQALDEVPPKSKAGKIAGWAIVIALIAMVAMTFSVNPSSGWEQTRNWLLLTMGGAGLGAVISLAHPLTILTSIVMAPVSAISPVLATGWFAGLAEAYLKKPKVTDFEQLSDDLTHVSGIWKNKITRILLVIIMTNLGCAIGNILGSIGVITIFLNTYL